MLKSRYFQFCIGVILTLTAILLATKVSFIFTPVKVLFNTLFVPVIIAGVLFYLFNPLVNFLEKKKVPRVLSIALVFIGLILVVTTVIMGVTPVLADQVTSLIESLPYFSIFITDTFQNVINAEWFKRFQESTDFAIMDILDPILNYGKTLVLGLTTNIAGFIGAVTNIVMLIVTVPLILFYLLKEGSGLPNRIMNFFPRRSREDGLEIIHHMNSTLSTYIRGQITVSFIVGTLLFIGYIIIGLDYALLLAIVAMCTNIIPYLGAFIAGVPAVLVAMTVSPSMVVKVLIVMIAAQQLEGNIITPQIMGKTLEIHPVTIVFLIMVSGSLAGVAGIILAVPMYAVCKVLVMGIIQIYHLNKSPKEEVVVEEGSN